jgi:hypothetical protein
MCRLFAERLKRVEWDSPSFPVYPLLLVAAPSEARPIVIDPRIAFRPARGTAEGDFHIGYRGAHRCGRIG